MRNRLIFSILVLLLSSSSKFSYSQDLNINFGGRTLGLFIPLLMGEVEYVFSGQSMRVNYYSNFQFEIFGSSKYEGVSVEYSFNETIKELNKSRIYFAIGTAIKREGSSYDENYKLLGMGYEKRYFSKSKGRSGSKYMFMRYYFNYIEEESLSPFNTANDGHLVPGFAIGLGY